MWPKSSRCGLVLLTKVSCKDILKCGGGIIPRLQWPFLLNDIPITTVKAMELTCNVYLRKWLGVPPSFSAVNLYSKLSKATLPISSVVEDYKAGKVRAITTLRSSKDLKVHKSGEVVSCGQGLKQIQAIKEAEDRLRHQKVVGVVCQGILGLGNYGPQQWNQTPKLDEKQWFSRLKNWWRKSEWSKPLVFPNKVDRQRGKLFKTDRCPGRNYGPLTKED